MEITPNKIIPKETKHNVGFKPGDYAIDHAGRPLAGQMSDSQERVDLLAQMRSQAYQEVVARSQATRALVLSWHGIPDPHT